MDFKEIQELIKLITKTKLTEFKMKDGDFELAIRTQEYIKAKNQPTQQVVQATPQVVQVPQQAIPSVAPSPQPPTVSQPPVENTVGGETPKPGGDTTSDNYIEIKSPMVGTFYRSPSPEKPAYVQVGEMVEKDSIVCIIEAMKLFNEIEAEVSGKIVKVLVEDAQPVEYEQPLYLVEPN